MSRARDALCAIALCGVLAGGAAAAPVPVLRYDMPNGDGQAAGGSFNYWDRNYSGSGSTTTDGAPLVGGLGKLADGLIATQTWDQVSNSEGTGPYVGWKETATLNPTITFYFAPGTLIDAMSIYLDNSQIGGVYAPAQIVLDGVARPFGLPPPGTVAAVTFYFGQPLTGTSHTLQFMQPAGTWTFVSEVSFSGVPETGSLALMLAGLAVLGVGLRLRRR